MKSEIKKIKKQLRSEKKEIPIDWDMGLDTGSTLLNLACTDKPNIGLLPGFYYLFVGDSISGKTLMNLTFLAEAANNSKYDNYRLIYDKATEDGALMNLEKFFGKKLAGRIESPGTNKNGEPIYSEVIEEFYYFVDDAYQSGKPFIYILDSVDSLSSEGETTKFGKQKKAFRKGKVISGSYGDGKAKKNSSSLRMIIPKLKKSGSILVIINQTRDDIGSFFGEKTRSGGHALKFYATLELWSSVKGKIKKSVRGKDRVLGRKIQIKVQKNRFTGKESIVEIPIYRSFGIDDTGSCVNYLLKEGHWKKTGKSIKADEFEFVGSLEDLIKKIEEEGQKEKLRQIVNSVWEEIDKGCKVERKLKYE